MPTATPTRWSAPTPGLPKHLAHRIRCFSAPAGSEQGGAGGDGDAAAQAAAAEASTQAGADATAQAAADAAVASSTWDGKVESLDPAVQNLIKDLRKEAIATRTNSKATAAQEARDALVQDLGKALGFVKDGEAAPTPEVLAQQIAAAQSTARSAQVELAVFRSAGPLKADPQALLDSRSFLDSVKDIDPSNTAAVNAAVTKAIADNPRLKLAQAAGSSGSDHVGGSGGPSKTRKSLEDAISGTYTAS